MTWRFADLPIRTKFLITLGIPVAGLVLLIGKQVISSLNRRDVLQYVSIQAGNIRLMGDLTEALQQEGASSVAWLSGVETNAQRMMVRHTATDAAIERLNDPALQMDPLDHSRNTRSLLNVVRERVLARSLPTAEAELEYQHMSESQVEEIARVFRRSMDPETNQRLYAHLSLLNTKEGLNDIRMRLTRALATDTISPGQLGELNERIAQYETNTLLFLRDAPENIQALYRETFRGEEVNYMRTIIGTIHEKRSLHGLHTNASEWWALSSAAMDHLRMVEGHSIANVIAASESNSDSAQRRLFIVLSALLGVVGAVGVMAFVIMRGIRSTVEEVTSATSALAMGDVRAHVPVSGNDEVGQMAQTFNAMIDNVRSLAASADAIGKGNYETEVLLRGEQDVLGTALARMRDNLKAARDRDLEQNLALQREKEKLERANERIHVLIKEIHHRVKNNLQVVVSLLRLQSETIDDEHLKQVFGQSQSRVASMALIHEKLYKGDDLAHIDITQYLKELFSELVHLNNVSDTIRYKTTIHEGLTLDLDTMVPLGLVLNELISNSFKHAFQGRDTGLIDLRIQRVSDTEFDLKYSDDGVGIPKDKLTHEGATLGMSLIDSLVEQLNGYLTVESDGNGTRYHVRFKTA
ncbi:MAG: nitrate- and nitrite sensing domain-containing protein [Flavobacteriales bacterium]|nr:nitrate- and nitrite sensing domain-containing protein [Flavobacteriales bacterium]MBL0045511.1 nitrate- and nitrite sensing domain-containing protein [Flavobacteriales bacterium]